MSSSSSAASPAEMVSALKTNAHLKKVLKNYQMAAMTSLNGPNSCMANWVKMHTTEQDIKPPKTTLSVPKKEVTSPAPSLKYAGEDPFLTPPPFPIQQMPILTAPDQGRSERSETVLEGEKVSCFIVGGEKRLCLPQILNSVLRDFSLPQINGVCDELQIFCSRCNHEQLEVLKVTGILPATAPSCGLITKTDAERLCNALLHRNPPQDPHLLQVVKGEPPDSAKGTLSFFKVYHECFGKCSGVYMPNLYVAPNALCIKCTECHGFLSPQKFVCHAHKSLENRTCHWGFDSANWRAYILLAKDQPNTEQLQVHLDEMKTRYDFSKCKRKQYEHEEKDLNKKLKYGMEDSSYLPYMYDPMMAAYWYQPSASWSRVSAFRPWSPMVGKDGKPSLPPAHAYIRESVPQSLPSFLSHDPPVLLNPERVVPVSETERFERHYQPNVALAPPSAQIQANHKTALTTTAPTSVPPSAPPSMVGSSLSSSISTAKSANPISKNQERQQVPKAQAVEKINHNHEIDLSTDTDETLSDSTISAESMDYVPDSANEHHDRLVTFEKIASSSPVGNGSEVEPIRKILESRGINGDVVEDVLKEVDKLQRRHRDEISMLILTKKSYQQELEAVKASKREKLREATEAKRSLRKELEQLHIDHDRQMRDAVDIQNQLRREVESSRNRRGDKIHEVAARANLSAENEQLKCRLEACEAELQTLQSNLQKTSKGAQKKQEAETGTKKPDTSPSPKTNAWPSSTPTPPLKLEEEEVKEFEEKSVAGE